LKLENVTTFHGRAEEYNHQFDFIVSRATSYLTNLITWSEGNKDEGIRIPYPMEFIALKGGDLKEEMSQVGVRYLKKHKRLLY